MIYVDLDDRWIHGLLEELDLFGYELPPYFYPPSPVGAHITILPSPVAKELGLVDLKLENWGEKVDFVIR